MTIWREEILHSAWRARFEVSNLVYEEKSEFQDIVVFDNENYDRILMIDNIVQLSTRDEFIYHEMMSHVALFSVENPASVLIIGGGDGGIMREALRHKSVTDVTLCELDEIVINISKKYLPSVAGGAFEDPRAKVEIGDGAKFMAETEKRFDAILVDSTDPIGPGEVLFSESFYANCARCLKPGGVLVTQQGAPIFQGDELRNSLRKLRPNFGYTSFFLLSPASYFGGNFALGFSSNVLKPKGPVRKDPSIETKYYSPEIHASAFVIPNYIKQLAGACD
ncbi:MAG: polyamine aminopropyltransferase [Rhodomicrobium sp.]